jgi:hypothetical protein
MIVFMRRRLPNGADVEVEVTTAAQELDLLMSDGVRTTVRRVAVGSSEVRLVPGP